MPTRLTRGLPLPIKMHGFLVAVAIIAELDSNVLRFRRVGAAFVPEDSLPKKLKRHYYVESGRGKGTNGAVLTYAVLYVPQPLLSMNALIAFSSELVGSPSLLHSCWPSLPKVRSSGC